MEEYIDFLTAALMTALVVGIVGLVVAGGYMLYKIIKDEY